MTQRDYQAIARAIHEHRAPMGINDYRDGVDQVVSILCDVFKADNPRFDRDRFIEACETGKCKGMPR